MGPSPALVGAAPRTLPRAGWRTGVDSAVSAVLGQPSLWLTGALGFLLRGGVLVLLAPVLVLPTPIEIRSFLGPGLGSAGFSPELVNAALIAGAIGLALVLVGLLVLSWLELNNFERLVADPEASLHIEHRRFRRFTGAARRRLLLDLFGIQWAAFGLVALSAIPLIVIGFEVTYAEIIRPTSGESLYVRILGGLQQPLFLFVVALIVVEVLAATASRSLLTRRLVAAVDKPDEHGRETLLRVFGSGVRTLVTAVMGWSVTLALVVPSLYAISLVWHQARTALLMPGAGDPAGGGLVMAGLLAASWLAAIALAGFASALRGALWSVESLR
jgi:hypothetical protein